MGDTTVVRVVTGSVWRRRASLREDLRLGSLEGEGPEVFGEIAEVAVGPDGSMFVFDRTVPELVKFGGSGEFLGFLGRHGQGPGEYSAHPNGLAVGPDGRVLLSDPRNGRFLAYSSNGELLATIPGAMGLRTFGRGLAIDVGQRVYVRVLMTELRPGEVPDPWPIGLEVRDSSGTVEDTVPRPTLDGRVAAHFEALPDGSLIAASGHAHVFEIHERGGAVLRVEMPLNRVAYTDEELAAMGRRLQPAVEADGGREPSLPETKPAYIQIIPDPSGRVWMRRPVEPGAPGDADVPPLYQPSVLDVFGRDGTYLGVVELPPKSWPVAVRGDFVHVVELGEYDEQYLVRYELEVP